MILDTDLVCTPRQEHAHCSGTAHVITPESMPNYAVQSIHIPVEPSPPSPPSPPLSSRLLRHANKFAARFTSLLQPTPSSAEVPIGFCDDEQEEHTIVFDETEHVVSASTQVARIPFLHGTERPIMLKNEHAVPVMPVSLHTDEHVTVFEIEKLTPVCLFPPPAMDFVDGLDHDRLFGVAIAAARAYHVDCCVHQCQPTVDPHRPESPHNSWIMGRVS